MVIVSRWGGYIQSTYRGHYITNPNNALLQGKFPQNCHIFALFHPPKIGNLMTPDIAWPGKHNLTAPYFHRNLRHSTEVRWEHPVVDIPA